MNKFVNTLITVLCVVACVLSCQKERDSGGKGDDKVAVTGVSLNSSSLTLTEGETSTLSATITPSTATNKSVTWSSDNYGNSAWYFHFDSDDVYTYHNYGRFFGLSVRPVTE